MSRFRIVFDSKRGQTRKIANRLARDIQDLGYETAVHCLRQPLDSLPPRSGEVYILGTPVYRNAHSNLVEEFIHTHRDHLTNKPSFFFSVSLSAAGDSEERHQSARNCVRDFLSRTDWSPTHFTTFAGSLKYQRYGWAFRWLMSRVVAKVGGDTDTSHDHEYTDWDDVSAFARDCVSALHNVGGDQEPTRSRDARF